MPRLVNAADGGRRALLAMPLALGATPLAASEMVSLRGTVTYRERIALPPGAVLEVALIGHPRPLVRGPEIAAIRQEVQGQVPIAFALTYPRERILRQWQYALHAALLIDGRRAFATGPSRLLPDPEAPAPAELLLVRDGATGADALLGHRWIAAEIACAPVAAGVTSDITFTAEGQVHGSGGCNRIAGGYRLEGADGIRIGPLAGTMMACEGPQDEQERRFHNALGAARHWDIESGTLLLRDGGGTTVLRLRRA